MTHTASWIAFVGLIVAVVACNKAFTDEATNGGLPLVDKKASFSVPVAEVVSQPNPKNAPICQPAQPNPCDRVNCHRVNTRSIA